MDLNIKKQRKINRVLSLPANVNKIGPDYLTPLLLASAGGHHEIVRLLLLNKAVVDHMDITGKFLNQFPRPNQGSRSLKDPSQKIYKQVPKSYFHRPEFPKFHS